MNDVGGASRWSPRFRNARYTFGLVKLTYSDIGLGEPGEGGKRGRKGSRNAPCMVGKQGAENAPTKAPTPHPMFQVSLEEAHEARFKDHNEFGQEPTEEEEIPHARCSTSGLTHIQCFRSTVEVGPSPCESSERANKWKPKVVTVSEESAAERAD
ncbi:hypothetical protein U1Q18_005359 [Sarracenia purpurea var. burkii]